MAFTAWTTDTLKAQILGELAQDRNVVATAPDRLENIVIESGMSVWYAHTWRHRKDNTTLPPYELYSPDPWSDSALADNVAPTWPAQFNHGWRLHAIWMSYDAFGSQAQAAKRKNDWDEWLARQLTLDEVLLPTETPEAADLTTVNGLTQSLVVSLGLPRIAEIYSEMEEIVRQNGIAMWTSHDWRFRARQGTLSLVADDAVVAVPADFAELDQRWLRNMAETGNDYPSLRFTEDPIVFQRVQDRFQSGDTGTPQIACFVRDYDTAGSFVWEIMLAPAADNTYSYKYWYLILDPWTTSAITDAESPKWPATFNKGWLLKSKMEAAVHFAGRFESVAKAHGPTRGQWKDWIKGQVEENNETMTTSQNEYIEPGYSDIPLGGFG